MTKAEKAKNNFLSGANCAQAVLMAFCEDYGMDAQTAGAVAASFGGGLGRLREVCGAVSGAAMVLGLAYGGKIPKAEQYALTQRLAAEFKEQRGSYVCREILGLAEKTSDPVPGERTPEYYKKRPCPDTVALAAEILDRILKERAGDPPPEQG